MSAVSFALLLTCFTLVQSQSQPQNTNLHDILKRLYEQLENRNENDIRNFLVPPTITCATVSCDGKCLPQNKLCDGKDDCNNGADEKGPNCPKKRTNSYQEQNDEQMKRQSYDKEEETEDLTRRQSLDTDMNEWYQEKNEEQTKRQNSEKEATEDQTKRQSIDTELKEYQEKNEEQTKRQSSDKEEDQTKRQSLDTDKERNVMMTLLELLLKDD